MLGAVTNAHGLLDFHSVGTVIEAKLGYHSLNKTSHKYQNEQECLLQLSDKTF